MTITVEQIPDEVVLALRRCGDVSDREKIAAALNAWPGRFYEYMNVEDGYAAPHIILPLPQEGE